MALNNISQAFVEYILKLFKMLFESYKINTLSVAILAQGAATCSCSKHGSHLIATLVIGPMAELIAALVALEAADLPASRRKYLGWLVADTFWRNRPGTASDASKTSRHEPADALLAFGESLKEFVAAEFASPTPIKKFAGRTPRNRGQGLASRSWFRCAPSCQREVLTCPFPSPWRIA